jgi:hydrogenase nickel incorporation protein HypA/HybF
MAIVQDIVETLGEACGGKRVRRVMLEIGALSGVVPDAIASCFEVATTLDPEDPLYGAKLEITVIPGRGTCRACSTEVEMIDPLGECPCGGLALDWTSGTRVSLRSMEVAS